jgi:hypothetical protein
MLALFSEQDPKGLNDISPLINQKITSGSVKRINEITGQMVKAIDSRAQAAPLSRASVPIKHVLDA